MIIKPIESTHEVDALLEASTSRLQVVYKHSTMCPVSYRAYLEIKQVLELEDSANVAWFLVDVIANRMLSQRLATTLGVRHESPQILFIREKQVVKHYSHSSIRKDKILLDLKEVG